MSLFPDAPNVTAPILHGVNDNAPLLELPSLPGQETLSRPEPVRRTGCNSELCRYCNALEKSLLWEDFYVIFINIYVLIMFNTIFWSYNELRVLFGGSRISFNVTLYIIVLMFTIYQSINWITPKQEPRTCSRLHLLWKKQYQLRQEQPSIYCLCLCSVAIGVWLFGLINSSYRNKIYWSILFAPPILQLPLGISQIITPHLSLHGNWMDNNDNDSDEDEFLPIVTEANLQILNHVGETGDHFILSPSSSWNDPSSSIQPKEDSLNEEDLIEGLDISSQDEGSTDGAELLELELSLCENDGNDLKFHTNHFNNTSSSEEEILDSKKIIPSESENSDFEIIDEQEVADIKM